MKQYIISVIICVAWGVLSYVKLCVVEKMMKIEDRRKEREW